MNFIYFIGKFCDDSAINGDYQGFSVGKFGVGEGLDQRGPPIGD